MKSTTILSVLATAAIVSAQSIPAGISASCTSFLTAMNSETSLATCSAAVLTATAAYAPGANGTTSPTTAGVTAALSTLCSSTTTNACSATTMRTVLANFQGNCSAELTTSAMSIEVIAIYDIMYAVTPMQTALCAKDDNGGYCVLSSASSSNTSSASAASPSAASTSSTIIAALKNYLSIQATVSRRASSGGYTLNQTTFNTYNVPYMLLTPSTPSAQLCTTCTRNILTAYINFQSNTPYAPGLVNSQMMGGQTKLYTAVVGACGASFMSGAVQAAGGIAAGLGGSSSSGAADIKVVLPVLFGSVIAGLLAVL